MGQDKGIDHDPMGHLKKTVKTLLYITTITDRDSAVIALANTKMCRYQAIHTQTSDENALMERKVIRLIDDQETVDRVRNFNATGILPGDVRWSKDPPGLDISLTLSVSTLEEWYEKNLVWMISLRYLMFLIPPDDRVNPDIMTLITVAKLNGFRVIGVIQKGLRDVVDPAYLSSCDVVLVGFDEEIIGAVVPTLTESLEEPEE